MNKSVYDAAVLAAEKLHNEYRKRHGALPLHLDPQLNVLALAYAKAVANGKEPTPTDEFGRNEYQSTGEVGLRMEVILRTAVTLWYSYIKEYNWDCPSKSSENARLFSQIVWASAKALGIGIAIKGKDIVVIALYGPQGNLSSNAENRENVQKALSSE